jgi:hypothetical protein
MVQSREPSIEPPMSHFAFLANNSFLKIPVNDAARPFAVAGIAWDGPAPASARARSAKRATCCATARTRCSICRPNRR